jgi:hypothetical protein
MAESESRIAHRVSLLVRRIRLQVEELFDQAWAVVPSQPVLNFFLFAAAVAVILIDTPPIAFERLGVGQGLFFAWCVLSLSGPVGVSVSRQLITRCRLRKRLFGFWLRLAADLVQFLALAAFLVARQLAPVDDSLIFSQIAITGIWVLQGIWVLRDVWALVLIERTATRLSVIVYGR